MRIFIILLLVCVLFAGLSLGALCIAERNPPPVSDESQAIIVLGCQVYENGDPCPQLVLRLQTALETYLDHPRLIVTCGGQANYEPAPEGQVMREWLIAHGVPPDHVIAETKSGNTMENIRFAKALLPDGVTHVTVVTSDYHLPRAMAVAKDLGLDADGVGSPCEDQYWTKNHSRELLAWGKYFLNKVTGAGADD